ncbi:hypothetical protein [Glycomyces tarimensis]
MLQALRRLAAAAALATGLAIASTAPANAAVTVTLTPTTATAGTTVTIIAASCAQSATAAVEGTDLSVDMPTEHEQAKGTFVVPNEWPTGTYSVAVTCGEDTAAALLNVTDGSGAKTGSGSTATDPTAAIALTGAAAVVVALTGLWFLRHRSKITT